MITIHVGLHKTGSTSIQAALRLIDHRRDLLVVPVGSSSRWTSEKFPQRLVDVSRSRHVIVSDENLLGEMLQVYSSAAQQLMQIREALDGADYQIVMYLRPQASWLASAYLQHIQEGGTLMGSNFLEEILEREFLEWRVLCGLLSRESGARRVWVRAYVPGRDVVRDFFAISGLGSPPVPTTGKLRINASISATQALILRTLNADPSVSPDERLLMRRLFQGILVPTNSRCSPFPQQDQETITRRFWPDWIALAEMLDDVDPNEAQVFRKSAVLWDTPALPYAGSRLSDPEVVAELLRCLRLLGAAVQTPSRSMLSRALDKATQNPRDLPRLLSRTLRRRI